MHLRLFLFTCLSFIGLAQTSNVPVGSVTGLNFCSTCSIRGFIPGISQMPPQVQVWIYDPPSGSDVYFATLVYVGVADGAQHTVTQYVTGFGQANTVWYVQVDAANVVSVSVQPMKASGTVLKGQ